MKERSFASIVVAVLSLTTCAAAQAGDPTGLWLTEEKESQIRIAPCAAFAAADRAADSKSNPAASNRANPRQAARAQTLPTDAYCGRIAWLREPIDPETGRPKTDSSNPDPALRSRPLIGLPILIEMKPGATPDVWEGNVYNALNGKIYSANIMLTNPTSLRIQGCVFGGFFCGSSYWTRVNDAPPAKPSPRT